MDDGAKFLRPDAMGPVMATSYNEDSYQLKQVTELMTWCADHGVKSDYLLGQYAGDRG
jgi:hypothetical protein